MTLLNFDPNVFKHGYTMLLFNETLATSELQ